MGAEGGWKKEDGITQRMERRESEQNQRRDPFEIAKYRIET